MATTGLRPDISLVASVAKMNTKLFPLGIPLGLPLLPIPLPRFDDLHVILPSDTVVFRADLPPGKLHYHNLLTSNEDARNN